MEFAIVCMLLITLAIGIVDFGVLAMDYLSLGSAAREGAREAAVGVYTDHATALAAVREEVISTAPTPDTDNGEQLDIVLEYRGKIEKTWGSWGSLNDVSPEASDVQVRVRTTYTCNRISGTLLGTNPMTMRAAEVRRRE